MSYLPDPDNSLSTLLTPYLNRMEDAPKTLEECFQQLSEEARELYLSSEVPELEGDICPLEFYRNWVSYNRPVIFRGAASHWPAISKWKSHLYLKSLIGDSDVTVTATPTGYADAIHGDLFVMPHEETMKFAEFLRIMEHPKQYEGVHYIQKQNSSLTTEFQGLEKDIQEFPWASKAFGKNPDAVNFWMGDKRAVTSMHKDPYENIYCVVKGYKDITLHPPTDIPWIPYKTCPQARFKRRSDESFEIEECLDMDPVPWIDVDPIDPDFEKYPKYENATTFHLRLYAGDALYLPSLWFHHISQSHGCIAVNYWYDMEFDPKYNYFNFLSKVANLESDMNNIIDGIIDQNLSA